MCFLCGIYEMNNFAFHTCLIFCIVGASPAPCSFPGCFKFLTIDSYTSRCPSAVSSRTSLQECPVLPRPGWFVSVLSAYMSLWDSSAHYAYHHLFGGVNPFSLDQLISQDSPPSFLSTISSDSFFRKRTLKLLRPWMSFKMPLISPLI